MNVGIVPTAVPYQKRSLIPHFKDPRKVWDIKDWVPQQRVQVPMQLWLKLKTLKQYLITTNLLRDNNSFKGYIS